MQTPHTHDMIYEYWDNTEEFTTSRIQDVGLISPGNGSVERANSRGQRLHDSGAHHASGEFLSDKQFLRSVQKRLPKVYLENIDPFAWESYKNGLAAEKRSKQMDISSMFNLDDIDEPEWANLNERIGDAVWNVDPD